MTGLDANVVIRYLTRDDEGQFAKARRLIEGELSVGNPGFVSIVVLAEIVRVLTGAFDLGRETLAEVLDRLLTARQLVVQESEAASQALRTFRAGRGDYVDILLAELGRRAGCVETVTFDRRASTLPGFRLLA